MNLLKKYIDGMMDEDYRRTLAELSEQRGSTVTCQDLENWARRPPQD